MSESTKISRARVMQNAHYMFSKCRGWYRTMEQLNTFNDFLAYAWRVEKKNVAAAIEVQNECKKLEMLIHTIRANREARKKH